MYYRTAIFLLLWTIQSVCYGYLTTKASPQLIIPELYNAARQEMTLTSTDLNLNYNVPLFASSEQSFQMNYSVSNFETRCGKLSFSGSDHLQNQSHWYHGINKIYYSQKFGNLTLETGIGYDYNREKSLSYQYDTNEINSYNNIQYNYINIKNIVKNSYFGNLNLLFSLNNVASLIAGLEFLYTTIQGSSYEESYTTGYDTYGLHISSSSIMHKYSKKDYYLQYSAGAGILRNESYLFKNNDALCIIFHWSGDHSYVSPKKITQPRFFTNDQPSINLRSESEYTNFFDLQFLRFNKAADSFNDLNSSNFKLQWTKFTTEYLKGSISYSNFRSRTLQVSTYPEYEDIDQLNYPKSFYQSNDLHLRLESLQKVHFFRYFYLNASSFLEYNLSPSPYYNQQSFYGWVLPGIGAKFPLLHTFLIDLRYPLGIFHLYTDFNNYYVSYNLEPAIQLRIAVLR
jgi:hypothetical protein